MCLGCVSLNAWFCILQDETAFACLLSSSVTCQDLLADLLCMSYVHHTTLNVSLCHQQSVYYVLGFIRVMNDKETTVSIINSLFINNYDLLVNI